MTENMVLIDHNGFSHKMTPTDVSWILGIGWTAFFSSILLNIFFYMIHPMAVKMQRFDTMSQCFPNIKGRIIKKSECCFSGQSDP